MKVQSELVHSITEVKRFYQILSKIENRFTH
jgi:hypothetical protein